MVPTVSRKGDLYLCCTSAALAISPLRRGKILFAAIPMTTKDIDDRNVICSWFRNIIFHLRPLTSTPNEYRQTATASQVTDGRKSDILNSVKLSCRANRKMKPTLAIVPIRSWKYLLTVSSDLFFWERDICCHAMRCIATGVGKRR